MATVDSIPQFTLASGHTMPSIGLGTWLSGPGEVEEAVLSALKAGYRHIDGAWVYHNEEEVGRGLKRGMKELGLKRSDIFITSKLWNTFHDLDSIESACRDSLKKLDLDYLDLYLIHWPISFAKGSVFPLHDPETQILSRKSLIDIWRGMEKLVDLGLVKSIGVSNFTMAQIKGMIDAGVRIPICTNQVECHPFLNQKSMIKFCNENKIFVTAYAPLGAPGRPARMVTSTDLVAMEMDSVVSVAKKHGLNPSDILLGWQLKRGVIIIPKSVKQARIESNLKGALAAYKKMDNEDVAAIDKIGEKFRTRFFKADFFLKKNQTLEDIWGAEL